MKNYFEYISDCFSTCVLNILLIFFAFVIAKLCFNISVTLMNIILDISYSTFWIIAGGCCLMYLIYETYQYIKNKK